jgi:hypothetical protein
MNMLYYDNMKTASSAASSEVYWTSIWTELIFFHEIRLFTQVFSLRDPGAA